MSNKSRFGFQFHFTVRRRPVIGARRAGKLSGSSGLRQVKAWEKNRFANQPLPD